MPWFKVPAVLLLTASILSAQDVPEKSAEKSAEPTKVKSGTPPPAQPAPAQPQTQQPTTPSQPVSEEELAKPESDRGDEGLLRQQPQQFGFRDPNRDQLKQKIENALRNDPTLRGAQIVLNIGADTIDVSGNADNSKQRVAARRIVQSFAGNLRVRERISVAGASPTPAPAPNAATNLPAGAPGLQAPSPAQPQPPAQRDVDPPAQNANRPHSDPKKDGDKSENPR
jgi:hypothetical protein